MKKPKIAILTIRNSYGYGGVLTSVKKLYKFCEKYFDPTIFYLSFDPKISANIKSFNFKNKIRHTNYFGMKAVEIGSRWAFWEPGHYLYSLPLWKKALKDYDYFIFKSGSCIASYPLIKLNKKFAMWIGTSYQDDRDQRVKKLSYIRKVIDFFAQFKMKKIEKEILSKANYIFSISRNTRKRVDQIIGYKRDDIAVCGFPIFVKINNKKLSKNKNIIAVGRFSDPRKNFDMLIKAFDKIHKKFLESKLYVVGKKPDNEILEKYSNLNCYKNILFTGMLDQDQLKQFYEISDLMLITSYQEGLGITGLEAMSFGLPVVSTKCGGTSDYVIDDKNGFLVDINDIKNMSEKAIKILSSPDLYNQFSNYALNFIKDNYSQARFESIIKYGLVKTYPELKDLFEEKDLIRSFDQSEKIQESNL
ncbi:glycosyltransferase [Candidatus Dependentiae bacterium]|nr:glycosyltransferase [Candidatus Dependentiae bacterium]